MPFDESDPHLVLAREEFVDLFADEHTARIIGNQLFTLGWTICEIRRTADGKIVRLDPIDAATIVSVEGGRGGLEYEQRIGDQTTWIDGDNLMVIRLDRPVAGPRATR